MQPRTGLACPVTTSSLWLIPDWQYVFRLTQLFSHVLPCGVTRPGWVHTANPQASAQILCLNIQQRLHFFSRWGKAPSTASDNLYEARVGNEDYVPRFSPSGASHLLGTVADGYSDAMPPDQCELTLEEAPLGKRNNVSPLFHFSCFISPASVSSTCVGAHILCPQCL